MDNLNKKKTSNGKIENDLKLVKKETSTMPLSSILTNNDSSSTLPTTSKSVESTTIDTLDVKQEKNEEPKLEVLEDDDEDSENTDELNAIRKRRLEHFNQQQKSGVEQQQT